MTWSEITLGEAAEIVSGATPKSSVSELWDGGVLWATPTDLSRLDSKFIEQTERTISERGLQSCSARLLPPGSVLFSSRAPIGLVAINKVPMATNQGFKSFVPKPFLDPSYLYWWLKANREQLQDLGNGSTFKEVSKSVVSRVSLPLPPIEEQRRIASILDMADAIRRKREQVLSLADELLKSSFLEEFGDPATNPKKIPTCSIGEMGSVVTGNTPPRNKPENYGRGIEWIKSDNINTPSHFLTEASERLSEQGQRICRTAPAGATLVTCIAGSSDCIGNAAMTDRVVAFNQQINAIIPGERTDPHFLYAQVLVAKELIQHASTKSMKGMVSKGKFQEIKFLAPDFAEQSRFGELFKKALSAHSTTEAALASDYKLFSALTQRAFRAQL